MSVGIVRSAVGKSVSGAQRHVGDLVVVRGRDDSSLVPAGILTDRDIVLKVAGKRRDPDDATVREAMSAPALVVGVDDQLTDALRVMSERGVRRAPVVDHRGLLRGIVTLEDLMNVIAAELAGVARLIDREQAHEASRAAEA